MIRQFHKPDAGQVMRIWLNANKEAHSFIGGDYWESNYEAVQNELLRAEVYVCDVRGEIRGFIGIADNYIAGIFVDKKYRSLGIGKELLDFTKSKYRRLSLKVYEKNKRAAAFYLREGFSVLSEGVDDTVGEKEYTMVWKNGNI